MLVVEPDNAAHNMLTLWKMFYYEDKTQIVTACDGQKVTWTEEEQQLLKSNADDDSDE